METQTTPAKLPEQLAGSHSREVSLTLSQDMPGIGRKGQAVKMSLTPADVADPAEMATYLSGFRPQGFRADEASPPVLVDKDEDKYRDFSLDDTFLHVPVKASIEGAIPEITVGSSLTNYKVVDRFLGGFINAITESNAAADGAFLRPRQRTMKVVGGKLLLDREIDTWTLLDTAGSWDAANTVTLGAGFTWDGGINADPIKDLSDRISASAQHVTDIWMNYDVSQAFIRNPAVRDHARSFNGDGPLPKEAGQINAAQAQMVDFKLPNLPIIRVTAQKVKLTAAGALNYVLGDSCILTTVPPGGVPIDGEDIATSYTFRRRGTAGVGFDTREFFIDSRGPQGGTMVVVSMADIAVMTGNNVGGRIANCLA